MSFVVKLPIRLHNPLNGNREHWTKIAKRRKEERQAAYLAFHNFHICIDPLPLKITLTRIAPRLFDDDNLGAAFKSIRDGIADRLNIDDGSDKIKFEYQQRKGKVREYAVEIEFSY